MKKIFFVFLFVISSSALIAQNPSWLVGNWSGTISLMNTDPRHSLVLFVPIKGNKLRLRMVGEGMSEKWNLKSVELNSATYSGRLSKKDTLLPKIIISLLDNNYINIDIFYPWNGGNEPIGSGRLKKD
jgi:hypothetical protein